MGAMRTPLRVWIPTNRSYANRSPKGMDGWNEIVRQNRKGKDFAAKCEEIANLDKAPKLEGRNMIMVLAPSTK